MADTIENSVNEHCLSSIIRLAQTRAVTAAEDIYDTRGMKLWAKDAAITPELQERLLRRKLRKPFEATLRVADGVDAQQILAEAQKLCDSVPALSVLMGGHQRAVVQTLAQIELAAPISLLLTTSAQNQDGLHHAVQVAMIAIAVGLHARRTAGSPATLGLAGLLHDVGELYINPDYLHTGRRLSPDEWKHVAVHPRVGEMVLSQLGCVPAAVTRAVGEHHERLDGNGYPRQITGERISYAGQVVGLADVLSGIINRRDNALARASLALRLVPGEHPHELISVIASLRQHAGRPAEDGAATLEQAIQQTARIGALLDQAIAESGRLMDLGQQLPGGTQGLAMRLQLRLRTLLQALRATGVHEYAINHVDASAFGDECTDMALELEMVGHEIGWRLRDMARELVLRLNELPAQTQPAFAPLLALLDAVE
jgi:HD superfamily phosphohydrolase YqeK